MFSSCVSPAHNFMRMEQGKKEQQDWVKAVLSHLGITATELARRTGVAPSTIHKPLNDPEFPGMISSRTIHKIAEAAGLRPMEFPGRARAFNDKETEPYVFDEPEANPSFERAIRDLIAQRNGRSAWRIRSYALEISGILPGDVLIVDQSPQPKPNDIVAVELKDWSSGRTENVFRLYLPPYVITNSLREGAQKPLPVDGSDVSIKGVVDVVMRQPRVAH